MLEASARHLDTAIRVARPTDKVALTEIAQECAIAGRRAEAIRFFRLSLAWKPDQPDVQLNLAAIQLLEGRPRESLASAEEVLRRHPGNDRAHFARAQALLALDRPADALPAIEAASRLQPAKVEYQSAHALALAAAGRTPQAVARLRKLVRENPDSAELLNNLAWLLAEDPASTVFDPPAAVKAAARAAELSQRQDPRILHTLAAAHAANAQPDLARAVCAEAAPLARRRGAPDLAQEIQALANSLPAEP
jgi:tetratricopeptide (TPR) repeat protein